MALAIVGIMVVTGFAVLGQTVLKGTPAPDAQEQPEPAKILAGTRNVTYTIDHMFELYEKSHDPADLGRWNGTMGLNDWWPFREAYYDEYIARSTYPFILMYNPYSTKTFPDIDQGASITTWYRQTVDAKNLAEIGAGPGKDPIFTPVLGPTDTAGAYMNISWYGTYLETWEMAAIFAGTHYANDYYGVPAGSTPREGANDGYFHELQGILTFNRAAAAKILGLTGAGDLTTQFTSNEIAIETAWQDNWVEEGGTGLTGIYDTYTAYDYSLAIQWLELSLDPIQTSDNLTLRFWSMSFGNECLMIRYMEAANVLRYWQGWADDWYLNISIGPDTGNVQSRAVIGYHMYATKDYTNNINGWALEASHMDWCGNSGNHKGYASPYTDYDPALIGVDVTHISTAPLTVHYQQPVSYILAPLHWNLTADEKFIVRLPSASAVVPGYYQKTSASDVLGAEKIQEMENNTYWGELVAGNGYPNTGANNLKNFYNKATKTFTLQGPMNIPWNVNTAFPHILSYGAPMFVMNVVHKETKNLVTGWNFVALPLAGYGYKASTLGLNNGDSVAQWNPLTRVYQTHIVGVPVNDFNILPSVGYWINVPTGTRTLTLYGVVPFDSPQSRVITIPAGNNWAIIGFASLKTTWHAKDIATTMWSVPGGLKTVSAWDPVARAYTSWLSIIPNSNNFLLVPGQAYWILVSTSGTLAYAP